MNDKEKDSEPITYTPALEQLTSITGKLASVTNQLNFLTSPAFQPNIISAVNSLQSQLSVFDKITTYLPDISKIVATSPMLDLSRQATIALSGLSTTNKLGDAIKLVSENYKPWYEETIAKSSILSTTAFNSVNIANLSTNISTVLGIERLSSLSLQTNLIRSTELSILAEKSLLSVNLDNIGSRIGLALEGKQYLTTTITDLSTSYSTLFRSFEQNPISYASLSPSLSKITPIEYFSTTNLLEAISVEEDITPEEELIKNEIQYENKISLENYLPKIDPGLYKMWKGAIEAYHSNNTDKVRHFATSIRELFTHIIHKLAPDDNIKKWTTEASMYHEGRPTRKARFLYICRNINNDPFNQFVKKDVDAMIAFIDIFQKGTHDIDPAFSPNHLITIKSKAETTLKFLLEIQFSTNN